MLVIEDPSPARPGAGLKAYEVVLAWVDERILDGRLRVGDTLPAELSYVAGSASNGWTCAPSPAGSQDLTCTRPAGLVAQTPGNATTFNIDVEIDQALVDARVAEFRDQVERRISGVIDEDHFKPLRLMNGLYLQLHAYMLRVAIPYGTLDSRQLRTLAGIGREFDRGYGHFTTRQNLQFNWIPLTKSADVMDLLAAVDMHGIQTSGNCIRNTTTDQFAQGREQDRGGGPQQQQEYGQRVDHARLRRMRYRVSRSKPSRKNSSIPWKTCTVVAGRFIVSCASSPPI